MNKTCVIIDDNDQSIVFNAFIQSNLKKKGYSVEGIIIDPSKSEFQNEEFCIDIERVKQKLIREFENKHIDVVVTDFELGDDKVNGLTIVKLIRQLRPRVPIVIYSGKLDVVIKSILGNYKSKSSEELIQSIRELVKLNIRDFLGREEYTDKVNQILLERVTNSSLILSKKLREFSDLTFKACYPKFQGKELEYISNEIDKQTYSGLEFQEELIEQVVSYLIKTNEDE